MKGRQQRALVGLVVASVAATLGWWMGTSTADAPGRSSDTTASPVSGLTVIAYEDLPPEAHETLELIESGGPFPYEQDGETFFNREEVLPAQERGYYREYTVETPGSDDRGARRIVTGADAEAYYTDDHYVSFARIDR